MVGGAPPQLRGLQLLREQRKTLWGFGEMGGAGGGRRDHDEGKKPGSEDYVKFWTRQNVSLLTGSPGPEIGLTTKGSRERFFGVMKVFGNVIEAVVTREYAFVRTH